MVPVVLANDLLTMQFPEPGVVVGAGGDKIRRVGAKGAVPDPALMAGEGGLEREWPGLAVGGGGLLLARLDLPDLGGVVGAAGGELLDVWGEEDAGDVLAVGVELGDGDELGALVVLDEVPDEDVAGRVGGAEHAAVAGHGDARDGHVLLGDEVVRARVLGQVPDAHAAGAVAANDLALVGVDDDVVGGAAVVVAALYGAGARLPDLDGAVLGAGDHPLALAVEGDAGDVARVTLKGEERVGVGRLDVVELDGVVAGGGEEALVRGDAEAIDLRVWVLNGARTDARESFPEADRVVVAGWRLSTLRVSDWEPPWGGVRARSCAESRRPEQQSFPYRCRE
jgi:hypothetical protein